MSNMENSEQGSEADLRIGLSSVCITPAYRLWLFGYAGPRRRVPFTGKIHDLYAKAIAFEDGDGSRSVLITLDMCVLRRQESERVLARIEERTGVLPERIVVNLSHTHSGPMNGSLAPNMWPVTPEMRKLIDVYTDRLIEAIAEAAVQALSDLRPARLSWGRGSVGFVRNRRMFDADGRYSGMKPNPEGFTDPRVTVLRVEELDGAWRGLVGSLACHAVTLGPANLKLCGDYPGFAKEFLQGDHPGMEAFFVQGCGADANSHPRSVPGQMHWARSQGAELAAEMERMAEEELMPVRGPIAAAQTWLDLPLRCPTRAELERASAGPASAAHNAVRLLELLDRGETPATVYRAPITVWRFGNDLVFVALPGETVSGFIPRMEAIFDPERLWVAGYCNDVFGYLPTAQIVKEGGYEDRGLVYDTGLFDAGVEDVVAQGVRALAGEVGLPAKR